MSHKIFDNNLVAIRKSKVSLKLNRPAYIGMCIVVLSKVLTYKFIMITLKINMTKNLLFTNTDSLMCEIKTEDVYEDSSSNKDMFDMGNYSTKSKYYDGSTNQSLENEGRNQRCCN